VVAEAAPAAGHVPGEAGIWVLVMGEMTIFAVLFCTYAYYRGLNPELYLGSQAALSRSCGLINTLLLLTSSWFVAMAVQAARNARSAAAARLLLPAFACGAAFASIKAFEYCALVGRQLTPATNGFYAFYFVLTGLHLLHLLIGMVVLAVLWRLLRRNSAPPGIRLMESGATYWHMVDVLWVVLFPLLYLIRGAGA
jgi:nitric oxide reductase NorE protein